VSITIRLLRTLSTATLVALVGATSLAFAQHEKTPVKPPAFLRQLDVELVRVKTELHQVDPGLLNVEYREGKALQDSLSSCEESLDHVQDDTHMLSTTPSLAGEILLLTDLLWADGKLDTAASLFQQWGAAHDSDDRAQGLRFALRIAAVRGLLQLHIARVLSDTLRLAKQADRDRQAGGAAESLLTLRRAERQGH
jgi:hypothetical protein